MASRQEQLHSHQFAVQRVVAALVMLDTDPVQSPFRRLAGSTLASVLVAAILLGGFVAYGAIRQENSNRWRDPQAVIVERESGARFVYRDGRLHQVRNHVSALLIIGAATSRTVLVSRRSIEKAPRGSVLGIVDAPDSLPPKGRLLGPPWTVCSAAAGAAARSTLLVGRSAPNGVPLADQAVLGRHADGSLHLIWQGRRHSVRDRGVVLSALGWSTERPLPVASALLAVLPVGADLARVPVPDAGERSDAVPDADIGEVFVVGSQSGRRQYAVALRDGLAGITQVQADLLLTDLDQVEPTPLSQGRFAAIPQVDSLVPSGSVAPPAATPQLTVAREGALCAEIRDDRGVAEVRIGGELPARPASQGDAVVVEPGRAAVVEAVPAAGASGAHLAVVTDLGRRHEIVTADVLSTLGYGGVRPIRLPAGVVSLVPAGVALDPEAARRPMT